MAPPILTVAETGSTNADLMARAREGRAEDGLWLRAERQVAGRGRHGRDWSSPEGNLYASVLLRLAPGEPPAPTLALVAALALIHALEACGARGLRIKWPNDLLLDGAKVSGILLERVDDWVVIGFGVNLASAPEVPGRRTARVAGTTPETLLAHLARELAAWRIRWRSEGVAAIAAAWTARAHPSGTPLSVTLPDGESIAGAFAGLAADGALRLALADGGARTIHAGDVFLI